MWNSDFCFSFLSDRRSAASENTLFPWKRIWPILIFTPSSILNVTLRWLGPASAISGSTTALAYPSLA
jgi:hypothetical protein